MKAYDDLFGSFFDELAEGHIPNSDDSLYAGLVIYEAQVRVASSISVAAALRTCGSAIWPSQRGLAGAASALRQNAEAVARVGHSGEECLRDLIASIDALDRNLQKRVGFNSARDIRNAALHGAYIPLRRAARKEFVGTNRTIREALNVCLQFDGAEISFYDVRTAPLVILSGRQLGLLEQWGDGEGTYWMFGAGESSFRTIRLDESSLAGVQSPSNLHGRQRMIKSILADIEGVGGKVITHEGDHSSLEVSWELPVVGGVHAREDEFRLGAAPASGKTTTGIGGHSRCS